MSDTPKLYAERRPMELEPHYSAHMLAMTVENLRGKSEIAEELAVRDKCIVGLERENADLRARLEAAERKLIATGIWREAPCCICGYNGPGYFQPSKHKCAAIANEGK